MFGFAAYLSGRLEERRMKILLSGNFPRISVAGRGSLFQEIVDNLLFQC